MSNTTASPYQQNLPTTLSALDGFANVRNLILIAFVIGATVVLIHRPFSRPEGGDPAIYDYIAQSIVRGQLPYRDVVDIKGPGAPYLSAAAMLTGKLMGVRDVTAVRMLNVVMVGLLSSLTFLVAQLYLRSRAAGLIAFMVPLMRYQFVEFMMEGTQPKLPMIMFGMLALVMIARDRPFWAGFCSMLSCLCWQPGLMFTGVAFLLFSRYLSSWRDLRALKVVLGAIIPLAAVLTYFYARGGLADLWAWTITYNYSVFGPDAEQSIRAASSHLWITIRRTFERDTVLVILAAIGLLEFLTERVLDKFKQRGRLTSPDLFRDAVLFPPLVYLAFSLINFQGGPDSIPFFPFIGIFAGWAIVRFAGLLASISSRRSIMPEVRPSVRPIVRLDVLLPVIAVAAMFALLLFRAVTYRPGERTLQEQYAAIGPVSELLGPEDRIYIHGSAEILVLLNRPNLNPYVFLDWGADDFAAQRESVRFETIIDRMEAQAPKLVSISRLRKVTHRADFEGWLDQHYQKLDGYYYEKIMIRR
jgi:hypothetical protein